MKNTIKKAMAVLSALALVVAGIATVPATANAEEVLGTGYIGFGETNSWSYNFYRGTDGADVSYEGTDVDGDGCYAFFLSVEDTGEIDYSSSEPTLFYIDFKGLGTSLGIDDITEEETDFTITDVIIYCDGSKVSVEQGNVYLTGGTSGDEESIRLCLMNPWAGDDQADAVIGTKLQYTDNITIICTISGTGVEGTLCNGEEVLAELESATATEEVAEEEEAVEEEAADDAADEAEEAVEETTESTDSESSSSTVVIVIVVIVIVAVVAGIVVSKKKK